MGGTVWGMAAAKKKSATKKAPTKKVTAKKVAAKKAPARPKKSTAKAAGTDRPLYNTNPWSTRRPQSLILTVVVLAVLVGVVIAAVNYINEARGGVVPVLMLAVAPVLAIYYVWYFNFSRRG